MPYEETMRLCEACVRLARTISQAKQVFVRNSYFKTTIDVLRQRQECTFCTWLLSSAVHQDIEDEIYPTLHSVVSENEGSFKPSEHYITYDFSPLNKCCQFEIRTPSGEYTNHLQLLAEGGSSTAAVPECILASEWPLPEDRSKSTPIERVRSWLDNCVSKHSSCGNTLSGETIDEVSSSVLPKRVLDIRRGHVVPLVKLLETRKQHARYVALSHCWGPPEKPPLRTTKANLSSNLNGILFESSPETFQDAVEVTCRLGIQYLWIDSLCIIQDDEQDWRNEAAKMGDIFENAFLTIGAAAAKDSTKGLFASIRRRQPRARIPYITGEANVDQSFQDCMLVEESFECSPFRGPLKRRGWVLQERLLSRRQVFFTGGGLVWRCREHCVDQFNQDLIDEVDTNWTSILHDYSRCILTYASDRLIGLDGLAERLKRTRHDRYSFGVWHTRAVLHLLWFRVEGLGKSADDIMDIPSWSWVARSGEKVFWAFVHTCQDDMHTYLHDASMMNIQDSGLMTIQRTPTMSCRITSLQGFLYANKDLGLVHRALWERVTRKESIAYICALDGEDMTRVGIAAMDEENSCSPSHCISLMLWATEMLFMERWDRWTSTLREEGEEESNQSIQDEQKSWRGLENSSEHDEDDADHARTRAGTSERYGHGKSEYWHIVLMLEQVGDGSDHFRRVGMGIIPDRNWKTATTTLQEIHLV